VFQFYPENPEQVEMITSSAMRCGFSGGLVIDYPNSTKRKKYFLCLFAGVAASSGAGERAGNAMPKALTDDMDDDGMEGSSSSAASATFTNSERQKRSGKMRNRASHDRDWILHKKETARRRGQDVAPDSKFTGRKRKPKF